MFYQSSVLLYCHTFHYCRRQLKTMKKWAVIGDVQEAVKVVADEYAPMDALIHVTALAAELAKEDVKGRVKEVAHTLQVMDGNGKK